MRSLLLAMTVSAFAVAPAAADCSFGMAHVSKGKPAQNLAMSPAKPDTGKDTIQTAAMVDGWLVKYLDKPVS